MICIEDVLQVVFPTRDEDGFLWFKHLPVKYIAITEGFG